MRLRLSSIGNVEPSLRRSTRSALHRAHRAPVAFAAIAVSSFVARHVDVEDRERQELLARVAEGRAHPTVDVEDAAVDLVQAERVGRLIDERAEQLRVAAQQLLERPALRGVGIFPFHGHRQTSKSSIAYQRRYKPATVAIVAASTSGMYGDRGGKLS